MRTLAQILADEADQIIKSAEAIKYVEAQELNGQGRRLIHLLLVTYSDLTAAQCSVISGRANIEDHFAVLWLFVGDWSLTQSQHLDISYQ